MFVISFSRNKFGRILFFVLALSICFLVIMSCLRRGEDNKLSDAISVEISGTSDVVQFISSLGWRVNNEPDEIREIIIPTEFNEVYQNYNELQISQGYDLSDYKGERVKRWSYTVTNYPGYESKECIKINVLVYSNAVIGGDVCSVELDGFMHGFIKES